MGVPPSAHGLESESEPDEDRPADRAGFGRVGTGSGNGVPRLARGGPQTHRRRTRPGRLTPACAGRTLGRCSPCRRSPAHPRLRGADITACDRLGIRDGSPPLARGGRRAEQHGRPAHRLTPACAGRTPDARTRAGVCPAHPRLRGADSRRARSFVGRVGSPPLARGGHLLYLLDHLHRGLTPACAGRTHRPRLGRHHTGAHPRLRGADPYRPAPLGGRYCFVIMG
ncbi:hypothetical protein UA75_10160 [Actinoalloteichus sp. GBA129-24]|nr:hypothetical protein UA75_10160 [Actinoalloteichus sp. GBA129-24]